MKAWKKVLGCVLILLIVSVASGWFYLFRVPQMKIDRLKAQTVAASAESPTSFSYLDHLKQKDKPTLSYLILGDSVAKGQKVEGENFAQLVAGELEKETGKPIAYENLGVAKRTSNELLDEFHDPAFLKKVQEADVISLNIGGNDLVEIALKDGKMEALKEYPDIKEQYASNIGQILRMIHVQNDDVIVLVNELYNVVDPSESFYPATKKMLLDWNLVAYEKGSTYHPTLVVPIGDVLKAEDKDAWLADQIHPNDFGHGLISVQIMKMLRLNYSN